MGLITYEDKLLQIGNGLTDDPNCCCIAPPPPEPCPPCCLRITSGALINGQIKIFVTSGDFAMEVTITTPSGTRVVCNHDTITVAIVFSPAPGSEGISPDAYATWDQIWRSSSITPATLGINSSHNNFGHVYWGNDVTSLSYSVDLKLFICHALTDPSAGVISVGSTTWPGLLADIEVQVCPVIDCCMIQPTCQPCCFFLVSLGFVWNSEDLHWERYSENAAFGLLATVKMGGNPLVCMEGEVQITLWIVTKDRNLHDTAIFNVEFDTEWPLTAAAGNDPVRSVGYVGVVRWSNVQDINYTLRAGPSCILGFTGSAVILWQVTETLSNTSLGGLAEFSPCDVPENCNCCCPPHCCGDCHFPLTDKFCEADPFLGYEAGGATSIVNFKTEITASIPSFCEIYDEDGFLIGYEKSEQTIDQVGVSHHQYSCIFKCPDGGVPGKCAQSNCSFVIYAKENCEGYEVAAINATYSSGGIWGLASGGFGYIWWVTGRTSYSGNCDGATASGSFVQAGRLYTWTTSFSVVRTLGPDAPACPLPEEGGGGGY